MKVLFSIVCVAVAAVLGYIAEPSLRRDLDRFFEIPSADSDQAETSTKPQPTPAPAKPQPEPKPPVPKVTPEPAPEPEPVEPTPPTEVTPALEPEPSDHSTNPEPEPQKEPEPPAPEPTEETTNETEDTAAADGDAVIKIMQDSIRNGDIKEFKSDQVVEWKASGKETIDGENFDTGLVSYKAETIFGVKAIQAKALIKNGEVARWIWPKSGMEIH
ncbi:hypothetical protein JIN85_15540 [Luteolibacter pohnpeiensis]|uniref:Uncharacterized protein n=1 Tax=Luteolibacter pohnpeiensis TaxID=454153 RepID=A0A934S9H4_9BACT|nr:hypothetical protein [Luteolibacter pohnpeiensis]MBK1883830.1 hypothetical protein [Luteolibacter pohnpeiensis]